MVSNRIFIFCLLLNLAIGAMAQTDSAAIEAIKMRNSLDNYLLQNVGNKPNTLKEKWMATKIDSLINLTQQLATQNELLKNQLKHQESPQPKSNDQVFTLYYRTNSYTLNKEGEDLLRKILNDYPNAKLMVKGYSDAYGNPEYNLILSLKRAAHVRAFLQEEKPNMSIEILAAETKEEAKSALAKLARKVEIYIQ